MLTGKTRAALRRLAANEDTIIYIGKGGISDNLIKQADDALTARELIKGKVQEGSPLTAREACETLSEACGAEPVQVIGGKFSLYRRNAKEPKIDLAELVKK